MKIKKCMGFVVILSIILAWSIFILIVGPTKLIEKIGIENGYLFAFLISALGGLSSFTATSFYITIITLSAGGLNPLILGVIGGIGLTIGDGLFFLLGETGRNIIPRYSKQKMDRFANWLKSKPKWLVPVITFIYAGFTPFPNDIFAASLALLGYPFKRIMIPILLGNIVLTSIIAFTVTQLAMLI